MSALVHVPTCAELGRRGLAVERTHTVRSRTTGETKTETRWEVTDAGYAEMREAMAHNARAMVADPALERQQSADAHRRTADVDRKGDR